MQGHGTTGGRGEGSAARAQITFAGGAQPPAVAEWRV
jgi:hypothetical protein